MATKATKKTIPRTGGKKTWIRLDPQAKRLAGVWAAIKDVSVSDLLSELILQHLPPVNGVPGEARAPID